MLDGQTWAEFHAIWCGGGLERRGHDPATLREQLNRKRAKLGKPPMKPAPKDK